VESNWVHSALRPPIGLLCQPGVIMMMEKLVEWLARETEVLRGNLPQCRFVHHKPHMLPWWNHGRRGAKPATNRLSYGTANLFCYCCSQMFYSSIASFYIMTLTGILVTRYWNKIKFYPLWRSLTSRPQSVSASAQWNFCYLRHSICVRFLRCFTTLSVSETVGL
jgi:hypothetical protein